MLNSALPLIIGSDLVVVPTGQSRHSHTPPLPLPAPGLRASGRPAPLRQSIDLFSFSDSSTMSCRQRRVRSVVLLHPVGMDFYSDIHLVGAGQCGPGVDNTRTVRITPPGFGEAVAEVA